MQNNPAAFQDAVARAKQIAEKLSASAPNANLNSSLKRPNSDDDYSNKRSALISPSQTADIPAPILRAQQIAQQINSQLGVKTMNDPSMPLSNQLTFQEDYKIPDKFVGLVIGKGGEQIVRIQAESGCKVQICQARAEAVPGGPNPPDRIANLSGTRDAIERAKRIMDEIVSRGRTAEGGSSTLNPYSMGGANNKSIDVMVPSAKCGLVIGKGGENIKRISEEFNVKLFVAPETSDIDGIEHKPLRIMGDPDRVERAKQHVLESFLRPPGMSGSSNRSGGNSNNNSSFNDYGSKTSGGGGSGGGGGGGGGAPTSGPCNEATYHVPYEKAGIIIGKGGESIKEINRKSGAFVELDKSHIPPVGNSSERVFKLRGTPDQIITAQQLMYDKVANGPGGAGDMLTPIQFQQLFNLPLVGNTPTDSWNGTSDPYANAANNNDPYSQWASMYGQWPGMGSYGSDGTTKNDSAAAAATDPSAMGQMDPAWLAYYQSMNYYNMMQSNTTGTTTSTSTKATDSTANNNSSTAPTNSTPGQADYSQQWIEYYRSMGQNELADQIAKQMKESTATTPTQNSAVSAWAAYAQQWTNAAAASSSTPTNGSTSSTAPSS